MDVSESDSASTSMMEINDTSQEEGNDGDEQSQQASRLQQKIDVVQQVVTILEQTMAQGKAVYERSTSSLQANMNILMKTIEGLKEKLAQDEAAFHRFSSQIGGEINRLCALDNILRTVEESQTENDVKILLPDVSDLDTIIQRFAAEKLEDWARLKDESKRLNIESKEEENSMKSLTFRVTIKKNIEDICPDVSANATAQLLNSFMGKSMPRDTIVKLMKLIWDERSFPSNFDMINTARRIVRLVFPEGDIISLEDFSNEGSIAGLRMEKVWLQGSRHVTMNDMEDGQLPLIEITQHRKQKGDMRVFQFTRPDPRPSNTPSKLSVQAASHPNPQPISINSSLELDDEIQFVKEIKRNSRVRLDVKYERSTSPGNRCITVVSPVRPINNNNNNYNNNVTPTASHGNSKAPRYTSSPKKLFTPGPRRRQLVPQQSTDLVNAISPASMLEVFNMSSPTYASVPASKLSASSATSVVSHSPRQSTSEKSKSSIPPEATRCNRVSVPPSVQSVTPSRTNDQDEDANPYDAEIFAGALLKKSITRKMQEAGINSLVEFQCKIIEGVVTGRDIFCLATEGVGKTIIFVLATLQKTDPRISSPQVFYVTSSTEKAQSVFHAIRKFSEYTGISYHITESVSMIDGFQHSELSKSATPHVIVGTMSSILKMLSYNRLLYDGVTTLVLDDLDEIMQKGLQSSVIQLVYNLNASIQTMVSSKQKTEGLEKLCNRILRNVVSVSHIVEDPREECVPETNSSKKTSNISGVKGGSVDTEIDNQALTEVDYVGESAESSSVSSLEDSPVDLRPDSSEYDANESESEVESCRSADPDEMAVIEDIGYDTLHMRRNTIEELETISKSENTFANDEDVMTYIPEYVLRRLGIPMIDPDCVTEHVKSPNEPHHISIIMDSDDMKVQTISLLDIGDEKVIIFCNSVEKVEFLATQLRQRHLWPQTMHEDLPLHEWAPVLKNFSRGLCKLIISTDFMAEVTLQGAFYIINYEFPIPARNYISRSAFANRHVNIGDLTRRPYVISFITSSDLEDVEDLRKNFQIDFQLQHEAKQV